MDSQTLADPDEGFGDAPSNIGKDDFQGFTYVPEEKKDDESEVKKARTTSVASRSPPLLSLTSRNL